MQYRCILKSNVGAYVGECRDNTHPHTQTHCFPGTVSATLKFRTAVKLRTSIYAKLRNAQ